MHSVWVHGAAWRRVRQERTGRSRNDATWVWVEEAGRMNHREHDRAPRGCTTQPACRRSGTHLQRALVVVVHRVDDLPLQVY